MQSTDKSVRLNNILTMKSTSSSLHVKTLASLSVQLCICDVSKENIRDILTRIYYCYLLLKQHNFVITDLFCS